MMLLLLILMDFTPRVILGNRLTVSTGYAKIILKSY